MYSELKKVTSESLVRALIIHLSITLDDVFNTYAQARYVSHLLPLLKGGRSYSLNWPNSVGIFTNAEFLPLFSNVSSPMMKRTKLFLTVYVHFALFKSSNFASLMPTSSHPLAMSSLASLSTPIPCNVMELVMIFVHAMRLRPRQDPHRCLCPDLQR